MTRSKFSTTLIEAGQQLQQRAIEQAGNGRTGFDEDGISEPMLEVVPYQEIPLVNNDSTKASLGIGIEQLQQMYPDDEIDEPCFTNFITQRNAQKQEESAARGGGSDGADSSGWVPIADDPLAGDQGIVAGGGAPIIIPSPYPSESWNLVTPKTDSVTRVDFPDADTGGSGLLRDGIPEHLPCEDGVPFNESQADPITGGTPDYTGVNNIGGYDQVETNYGDVSDNHARGFINPGNPETFSPLEFDVAVPLLTDKPVMGDQLEAVGANETCRQVGDPRTGISHMVCEQYMG